MMTSRHWRHDGVMSLSAPGSHAVAAATTLDTTRHQRHVAVMSLPREPLPLLLLLLLTIMMVLTMMELLVINRRRRRRQLLVHGLRSRSVRPLSHFAHFHPLRHILVRPSYFSDILYGRFVWMLSLLFITSSNAECVVLWTVKSEVIKYWSHLPVSHITRQPVNLLRSPADALCLCRQVFDHNGDGYISKLELHKTMNDLGIELSREDLDAMMDQADVNKDGRIDYAGTYRHLYVALPCGVTVWLK